MDAIRGIVSDIWTLDAENGDGARCWTFKAKTPDPRSILDPEHLEASGLRYVLDSVAVAAGFTDRDAHVPYEALQPLSVLWSQ